MTIDELFNMPIFQMKKWLSDNYKDPIGSYKNDYWFTNINECFGVKFPKGCGWRIIPCMSTFKDDRSSALDKIKIRQYNTLNVAVTKVSKYGECLTYMLSGNFIKYDYNEKEHWEFTDYMNRSPYKFNLTEISANEEYRNNSKSSHIYIGGPDIVNNSEIGVYYHNLFDNNVNKKVHIMFSRKSYFTHIS